MPDPRHPRGLRHSLASVLLASVAAVLAGARSLAAIGEWVSDALPDVLAALDVCFDPLAGRSGRLTRQLSGESWNRSMPASSAPP